MGVTIVDEFDLDVRLTAVSHRVRPMARPAYPLRFQDDYGDADGGESDSNTCYSTCSDEECGGVQAGTNGDCEPETRTRGCKTQPECHTVGCSGDAACPNQDDSNTCYSTCSDEECGGGGDDSNTCFSTCSDCPTVHLDTCVGDCTNECAD